MITKVDPQTYFQQVNLTESLVLRIRYLKEHSLFELVLAYANLDRLLEEMGKRELVQKSEAKPREFIRLLFVQASEISRQNVELKIVNPSDIEYRSSGAANPSLQWLKLHKTGEVYSILIGFGSFGDYSFSFRALSEERRLGKAVPNAAGYWDYVDIMDAQQFKFEIPFPEDIP